MTEISPGTRTLISRLTEPVSLWERLTNSRDDSETLQQIGDSNESGAIIEILAFVFSRNRETASAAAEGIRKLASKLSPAEIVLLDGELRERSPYCHWRDSAWYALRRDDICRLEGFGSAAVWLLGMASCDASGYVREEAIRRLDQISDGNELPFLLLRLNDWVENVRHAATAAVRSRLKPCYGRKFVANLALVLKLKRANRVDLTLVVEAIEKLLQSDECRPYLVEGFDSTDRLIRRESFRLAMGSLHNLPFDLKQAISAQDTMVRLWAAQKASALDGQTLESVLPWMRCDPFMPIRREALRTLVKRDAEGALTELRKALLDKHPAIREEARYFLQRRSPMDFALFYRQALVNEPTRRYAAIGGLGETGSAQDAHLLINYVSASVARFRRAAVKALTRLRIVGHDDVFIQLLSDAVSSVSREARIGLATKANIVAGEQLWNILRSTSFPHVRRNVLFLFSRLSKWESVRFLLQARCDADEETRRISQSYLERWFAKFNRAFTPPTRLQLASLRSQIERCDDLIDEQMKQELLFSLRGFPE